MHIWSVPVSTSCTDSTVKLKFSTNRGSYLQSFSWWKHWTKRFCADFSRSHANRIQVMSNFRIPGHIIYICRNALKNQVYKFPLIMSSHLCLKWCEVEKADGPLVMYTVAAKRFVWSECFIKNKIHKRRCWIAKKKTHKIEKKKRW